MIEQNHIKWPGVFLALALLTTCAPTQQTATRTREITRETKPWTRWWWHGSALTKTGITAELEAYEKAGIGGLEITPIYGVQGYEERFVEYLSPEWMSLLQHTLNEAERLDLGIDMATGTGWPFGGPWIGEEHACKNLHVRVYAVTDTMPFREKIEFTQQPYLRAVGYNIQPGRARPARSALQQPVSANKDLQTLALDQVIFERQLPLQTLMAYGENGESIGLTARVDAAGNLNWTPPGGSWKLYAIFQGAHGKMVERAAPGGEGNVIDHFSEEAVRHYLHAFDTAFKGHDTGSLRAFFNDSYEVDDARGAADWTETLFDEFSARRGYDLRLHLPALFGHDREEKNERVRCDYRETISEMVRDNFTTPWRDWAHVHDALVRNQAHGAPANILDLYAAVDIPEIEGTEPLRIKMASSAGNVMGKKLVSSESATWLNEHFESRLSDIKTALDRFMLHGVNHVFYHGTAYSPQEAPWPGWLFYAAVHFNHRNSWWRDADALNQYVARCQAFLQNSTADNDILLYYPIYDVFSTRSPEMIEHFDGIGRQFENSSFHRTAEILLGQGYSFDYISDRQIQNTTIAGAELLTEGGARYQTIVVPKCRYIPLRTFEKLVSLAADGASVLFVEGFPAHTAGFKDFNGNEVRFRQIKADIGGGATEMRTIHVGEDIIQLLNEGSVPRELAQDFGIKFLRKKFPDGEMYFLVNGEKSFEGWLPLRAEGDAVVLHDPMTGRWGRARVRKIESGQEIYLQLERQGSVIVEIYRDKETAPPWEYYNPKGEPVTLRGAWNVEFIAGGPGLPAPLRMDSLVSWTAFGGPYESFSGTASYTLSFEKPGQRNSGWVLDLGRVDQSAEVFLNGEPLATLIGPAYKVYIPDEQVKAQNTLTVHVSNLMANRIADMDRRKIPWRIFYNVNFPARKPENRKDGLFNAANWEPRSSGLLGPVMLQAVE